VATAELIEFPQVTAEEVRSAPAAVITIEFAGEGGVHAHCPQCMGAIPLHYAGCPVERRAMECAA
jgi:hypothetical protein